MVEGAGATGLAAVLQGLLPELQGKKYAVFKVQYTYTCLTSTGFPDARGFEKHSFSCFQIKK